MAILDDVRDKIQRRKAATFLTAKHIGKIMEGDAKQSASWEDQTGHARQGIQGGAVIRGDSSRGDGGQVIVYLAHTMRYGGYLETGTGLYGPKKQAIRPKFKKALRFPIGGGKFAFVRSVKGMKPMPVIKPTVMRHIGTLREAVRAIWRES
jgi:hypothetical protein